VQDAGMTAEAVRLNVLSVAGLVMAAVIGMACFVRGTQENWPPY
jgi:hypothetical protein